MKFVQFLILKTKSQKKNKFYGLNIKFRLNFEFELIKNQINFFKTDWTDRIGSNFELERFKTKSHILNSIWPFKTHIRSKSLKLAKKVKI